MVNLSEVTLIYSKLSLLLGPVISNPIVFHLGNYIINEQVCLQLLVWTVSEKDIHFFLMLYWTTVAQLHGLVLRLPSDFAC